MMMYTGVHSSWCTPLFMVYATYLGVYKLWCTPWFMAYTTFFWTANQGTSANSGMHNLVLVLVTSWNECGQTSSVWRLAFKDEGCLQTYNVWQRRSPDRQCRISLPILTNPFLSSHSSSSNPSLLLYQVSFLWPISLLWLVFHPRPLCSFDKLRVNVWLWRNCHGSIGEAVARVIIR